MLLQLVGVGNKFIMHDQQLIAIHHVTFYLNNVPTRPKKPAFLKKFISWYILTIFSTKHDSLKLSIEICKNVHQKIKILQILKCSLPIENTQNFGGWTSQNCNLLKSSLICYCYLSSKTWFFRIIY